MPATGMNRNMSNKDMSPTAPTSQKKSRRSALTRNACLQCRQAKTKCDGRHPCCARCKRTGATCHYDVAQEGITKMQSLQQKLDDSNNTLELLKAVIGQLQNSSDEDASNILARLRIGENIMEIGSTLIHEGAMQIPHSQMPRQMDGRIQHASQFKRYSSSSGSSVEASRPHVLPPAHDQDITNFNAPPLQDWPPSPESANTSFSSGITSTSQVGPMESSYLSAPGCEFDWPQQQNLFVASMSGAPPLIAAPVPNHQIVSAPATPMSEGPYRQAPLASYPRAVLPSNAPINGSPMKSQVGMPVQDEMDMINSARMMNGRADSVHEIPVILEPPKTRSMKANLAAQQHDIRNRNAKHMIPEYMWLSGSEDGFPGVSYPHHY